MNLKQEKIKHLIALITLGFCSVVFLLFIFWWIFPYKTLEVKQPYHVLETKVKQGEVLKYEIEYCKYTKARAVVRRQFVDGIMYAVPEITVNLKEGCGKAINTIEIPHNLPPGTYTLAIEVSYQVNPIRTIVHELKTDSFTVIK